MDTLCLLELQSVSYIYLHLITAHVQDLGPIIQVVLSGLRVWCQAQQVGVERHSYRIQRTHVNLCCQMALLLQAGFICWEPPEVTNLYHL